MISAPADAFASTIFPPSRRTSRSSTRVPAARRGAVERTTPSARRQSGLVKTSSVGMFGMCSMPASVRIRAQVQCASGTSPTVRSVPGPLKRTASKERSFRSSARACRREAWSFQASTGSSSSRRVAVATAPHSRSTSGSPKTCFAQPGLGADTIVQLTRRAVISFSEAALSSFGSDRPTSAGSRSPSRSGSGFPVSEMSAGRSSYAR